MGEPPTDTDRAPSNEVRLLASMTTDEIDERRAAGDTIVLLVPIGSCEQHGPHLPLSTDSIVAESISMGAATWGASTHHTTTAFVVAPTVAISASGEHAGFSGTLSIGTTATRDTLVELVRSADWVDSIVFVNGHGGNYDAVAAAVTQSHADGRTHVTAWAPSPPDDPRADLHAGWVETSVILHLAPHLVRTHRIGQDRAGRDRAGRDRVGRDRVDRGQEDAIPDESTPAFSGHDHDGGSATLVERLRRGGVKAVSADGVIGDERQANADDGATIFNRWVRDLCAVLAPELDAQPAPTQCSTSAIEPGTIEPGTIEPGTIDSGTIDSGTTDAARRS